MALLTPSTFPTCTIPPFPTNTNHLQASIPHFPICNQKEITMARLSSIIALFAVALLIADAYAYPYRTTITTVEVDEDNQGRQERCRHIRPHEQLRSCQEFLGQQGGGRREILENQWGREEGLEECCRQLKNVEEHCRCDALQEVARDVQSQQHGQQGSQILQHARMLPSMCQIHPQRCAF